MKTTLSTGQPLASHVPDEFFDAYVECALWSSSATISTEDLKLPQFQDTKMEEGMDYPLDEYFGSDDLAPETEDKMLSDCADFFAYCESTGLDPLPDYGHGQYSDAEMSGHDFWLTRNGHGAGYWDRGLDTGDALSKAAKTFGSADLCVGDDGLIYQS